MVRPEIWSNKVQVILRNVISTLYRMCISFVIWGNMIVNPYDYERLGVISLIYFVSLGIAAHVPDNIGSKKIKPWGELLGKKQSWVIIIICLLFSYLLGIYYSLIYAPLLILIGIAEGFFICI
jgi:hypothetical protein